MVDIGFSRAVVSTKQDFDESEGRLEYLAAKRAAVAETFEEAGLEINEDQLIRTAHWTTPPKMPGILDLVLHLSH